MTWVLDTNVCINYLKSAGHSGIKRKLSEHRPPDVALCSIVKAELLFGAMQSRNMADNAARLRQFFAHFPSLSFDHAAAETYAHIRSRLSKAGTPIGPNDLLIASIALANGFTLVTHNTKEFGRIEGLVIEDWEA